MLISIITAFYHGNQFLPRLVRNIQMISEKIKGIADIEFILVNDSPDEEIIIPDRIDSELLDIKIIVNRENLGIQKTRVNGLQASKGDWIVFLDQDDELLPDGFAVMLTQSNKADVIVGNLLLEKGNKQTVYYNNKQTMEFLFQYGNFMKMGNLIPSPGHCLIRKAIIPSIWQEEPLSISGADDYYLWILLLKRKNIFASVENEVYIHHDNEGNNLSLDLEKMYGSSKEMADKLVQHKEISRLNYIWINRCLDYNYLAWKRAISLLSRVKYLDVFIANSIFRVKRKKLAN